MKMRVREKKKIRGCFDHEKKCKTEVCSKTGKEVNGSR